MAWQPLSGVRVLDLSRLLPGPFCSLILSDLGATVDKLEDTAQGDYFRMFPPFHDGMGGRYQAINRDKRSFCVDLKKPEGRSLFLRLLPRYDVVLESFRPGVMARLGLDFATLAQHHPKVVLCSISGYGQHGPLKERAGHDLNYAALAGVVGLSGEADTPPQLLPIQVADLAGGSMWAAIGITSALYAAQKSGKGHHLDISMCEGALSLLFPELGNFLISGEKPIRGGELLNGGKAAYGIYETADGKHLAVSALEPKFWSNFNRIIGRAGSPEEMLLPLPEQLRIRKELSTILATKTQAEWSALFADADVCVEPVLAFDELADHPQHRTRDLFFQIGSLRQLRTPLGPRSPDWQPTPPPTQGQHTEIVLRDGGFSDAEIAALRQAAVIR